MKYIFSHLSGLYILYESIFLSSLKSTQANDNTNN